MQYVFPVGAYALHTRHLSLYEDLALRRLIDLFFVRGGCIPSSPSVLCRLIGMDEYDYEVAQVIEEFFHSEGLAAGFVTLRDCLLDKTCLE